MHATNQGCTGLTSVVIPNSVTSIGSDAFNGCSGLSSVEIPNSVTLISNYAFSGCTGLTSIGEKGSGASVEIPNSVTSIDFNAFSGCSGLTSVVIPNSVTLISSNAFWLCSGLTSVKIPNSVTLIGPEAFSGCIFLTDVYNYATTPQTIGKNTFSRYNTLHVIKGYKDIYAAVAPWNNFTIVDDIVQGVPINDGSLAEYSVASPGHCDQITYTRNFSNTNWQALYVPFGMEYDDWAEDFEIARLNDVHQFDEDNDGVIDRTALESVKLRPGSYVEPNTPYLIKAKTAGEKTITLTDATLYATAENSYDVTSWYTRFIFTGTYHTVTDMATRGHYALSGGGLKLATSDAVQLKPFRWYVDITDRNGAPIPSMANAPIYIVFDDGEETSIEGINAEAMQQNDDVYTVSGVKVTDKDTLPKGVYIKNGKKVLVK